MQTLSEGLYRVASLALFLALFGILHTKQRGKQSGAILMVWTVVSCLLLPLQQSKGEWLELLEVPKEDYEVSDSVQSELLQITAQTVEESLYKGVKEAFGITRDTIRIKVTLFTVTDEVQIAQTTVTLREQDAYLATDVQAYMKAQTQSTVNVVLEEMIGEKTFES